jgi:prepilin-type N-terminal cleavage/methylation domain-containing protein
MRKIKGFNLVELLVVLVIIGTLAALAWPNYLAIKEKALNREIKASLALIRAAEKIYKIEQGYYYPYSTATSTVSDINSYLKLSLPESSGVNWAISLNSSGSPEFAQATRTASDGRVWKIEFPGEVEPACSGGGSNCL